MSSKIHAATTARYALRMETADGTLEVAYHHIARKAWAISAARHAAKSCVSPDVVRIWVDDTKTDLSVKSFECRQMA